MLIELFHVEKTYNSPTGPVKALKDISLHIEKGEIYGIIGLSGAGKSTLVRCINMLEAPTSGSVVVDGQEMTSLNSAELRKARKNIGMIFQHFNLLSSATVYDNVAFPLTLVNTPKEEIQNKVSELLSLVGLADKADKYPAQLSGGQKQRVGIARALASSPNILLCDEATSALDPQTTKSILKLIKDINNKLHLTVVVITHEMQVIKEICDKVAVIENGLIAENGTVFDIFTNPQKPITKEFVSVVLQSDIPEWFDLNNISATPTENSVMICRLAYIGDSTSDAILCRLIKKFNLKASIAFGSVDKIQGITYGRLVITLEGNMTSINKGIDFLAKKDIKLEVIGYVRRHDTSID